MKHLNARCVSFLSALCAPLFLIACAAVGPEYSGAPSIAEPSAWQVSERASDAQISANVAWWQHFDDATLQALIERARSQSQDVRIALAQVDEARALYGVAASQQFPTVDLQAASEREQTSANATPAPFPSRTDDVQSIGAGFGWEVDLFGRVRRQTQAARANVQAATENARGVFVILSAQVASIYNDVRTLQSRLALARKNLVNQRETLRVVNAKYDAELTSELDVNQAKQNLARSESTLPSLELALVRASNRLAVLLGEPPGALDQILSATSGSMSVPEDLSLAIPRDLLRQRPDIRQAERKLAAQVANIGVAEADLYPRLSLSGRFGYATLGGSLLSSGSELWSFGPSLSWNIFDRGRGRARVALEDAKAEQARAAYEKTVLFAFEDVQGSLASYRQEGIRAGYIQASTQAAKNTLRIAKSQYKNGLTNFQTVLDAERVLFAEEDRLAESQGAIIKHLINVYRALGGGWSSDSTSADRSIKQLKSRE